MDLSTIWFWLIAVLLTGYAILDGFDFGVGILSLFAKGDKERRIHFNAIGPVWDGNEVWLITAGGALFAAFPIVYAAVFSGFYLALMILLVALIFRAVSFEFRSKIESAGWRRCWDMAFGLGSLVAALLLGTAFGNILHGVPLNSKGEYTGTFLTLLNPYSVGIGILGISLFTMHGALYLATKSEGALKGRCLKFGSKSWAVFVVLYTTMTVWTWLASPLLFKSSIGNPLFFVALAILTGSLTYLPVLVRAGKAAKAFLFSSVVIGCIMTEAALSLYPNLVPALDDPANGLTVFNSSSSQLTLETMLIIALAGIPFVLGYSIFIHRVFRGKVKIEEESY